MTKWRITPRVEAARIRKARRDCPTPILEAEDCIRKVLTEYNRPVVSWSGGKCSTVVLHMALQQDPDVRVVFNDTGVEFPETLAFVERLRDEWSLNLKVLKPRTTFWEVVEKYGFPMLRGQYEDNSKDKSGRPVCCQLLKEEPMWRRRIRVAITGIRVAESRMRMFGVSQYGQYYYAKKLGRWQFHPIAFWTTDQVWDYHEKNGIPHNEIYDKGHDRCGCWPCTGYVTWREALRRSHPGMYEKLNRMVKRMEGEPTLWEYQDVEGCRQEAKV